MRRALQRNTELRRAPGALYARLPLRALRSEEVAEREPAAVPARPLTKPQSPRPRPLSRAWPWDALGQGDKLKMNGSGALHPSKYAGVGTTHALYAQPQPRAQTGPKEQPDENTAAPN